MQAGTIAKGLAAAALLVAGWLLLAAPASAEDPPLPLTEDLPLPQAQTCLVWAGEIPLQQAVRDNTCVQMLAGTYLLDRFLILPAGHILQGDPAVSRDDIVLRAISGWVNTEGDGVVNDDGFGGPMAVMRHFTVDGNGLATGGIGARRIHVEDMAIQGGKCWGVAVAGEAVTLNNNWIHHNGADPTCYGAPGAGIYMVTQKPTGAPSAYAPKVTNNHIRDNTGPGLDIASVWNGTLTGNVIVNNSSWAGVSLFGSRWTISGNVVRHPATDQGQPYQHVCQSGPSGTHSAAIFLCQTTDAYNDVTVENTIVNNTVSSWYGILLVGNDAAQWYWAPRNNTLRNNNAFGSYHAFADDFRPGQWFNDRNSWGSARPSYGW